jgi:hypothetical protein
VPRARDLREAADRVLERARAAAEAGARAGR